MSSHPNEPDSGAIDLTELFVPVVQAIGAVWDRIGLAFSRSFTLIFDGAIVDVGLWDAVIVVATIFVGLCILSLFRETLELIHIGQEWVLEKVHNMLEGILDLVHRGMTKVYRGIRNVLRR
jgi:hypothetical protein